MANTNDTADTATPSEADRAGAVLEALMTLAVGIVQAAKDAGPLGAPAGEIYAVAMVHGVSLTAFNTALRVAEGAGLVRVTPAFLVLYTGKPEHGLRKEDPR